MSPFCSVASRLFVDGVVLDVAGFAIVLFMAQHANMRGVVEHMGWSKGFPGQVCKPVTEITVTRRDEASHLEVEGMTDG